MLVEGQARSAGPLQNAQDITTTIRASAARDNLIATDTWPFLYLRSRAVPKMVWSVLLLFLAVAGGVLWKSNSLPRSANREYLHMFLLGAGFLLLETKGVTELSLLFGSTWIVNAVVIGAFLAMALLSNAVIMVRAISRGLSYAALFALLLTQLFVPYSALNAFSGALKLIMAGLAVGLPVFFTGLIFSRSFRDVSDPAKALGVNLFGAAVGGILENLVMIGGTTVLGVLAIVLYAFSAVFVTRLTSAGVEQGASATLQRGLPSPEPRRF
jgi:hypothetical protein